MNITKKLLLSCFISIGIVACSDDDSDGPNNNNGGNNSTSLKGSWEAYEFKDSKGNTYGLNEWVPEYFTMNNCEVELYAYKTIKSELTIDETSLITFEEDSSRNRAVLNSDTSCNITYSPWGNYDGDSYTDNFNYEEIGSNIILWVDSFPDRDTVPFEIRNNILYIYPGTDDEFYYRRK